MLGHVVNTPKVIRERKRTDRRVRTELRRRVYVDARDRADTAASLVSLEDVLCALGIPPGFQRTGSGYRSNIGLVRAVTSMSDAELAKFFTKLASKVDPYSRFCRAFEAHDKTLKLVARLSNKGVNMHVIFNWLRDYVQYPVPSVAVRKDRARKLRSSIRRQVRSGNLSSERAKGLLARVEAAFDIKRTGQEHLTPLLFSTRYYIHAKTGQRLPISDLALLIEAVRRALMRWPLDVEIGAVRKELSRFEKRNRYLVSVLQSKVMSIIAGIESPDGDRLWAFVGDRLSQELCASYHGESIDPAAFNR